MSPDTLIEIGSFAFMAAALLSLRLVRPYGEQPRHGAAYLDAQQVPVEARHYRPARLAICAPAEPVKIPVPWTAPDVPATIPDALNTVRTA